MTTSFFPGGKCALFVAKPVMSTRFGAISAYKKRRMVRPLIGWTYKVNIMHLTSRSSCVASFKLATKHYKQ